MSQIRGKSIKSSYTVVYKFRSGNWEPLGLGWSEVHLYSDSRDGRFRLLVWNVDNCDKLLMNVNVRQSCRYSSQKPNFHTFKNDWGKWGFGFLKSDIALSIAKEFAETMKSLILLLRSQANESKKPSELDDPGSVQAKLEQMGLINRQDLETLNDDHGKEKNASIVAVKKGPQFGVPPESLPFTVIKGQKIPNILLDLKEAIIKNNGLYTYRIFVISPEKKSKDAAKVKINRGASVSETIENVHIAASLLKSWFRELPKPILDMIGQEKVNACSSVEVVKAHDSLPPTERSIIIWLWDFLVDVAEYSEINHMVIPKLAYAFAPCMYNVQDPMLAFTYNRSVYWFCTKAMEWRKEEKKKRTEEERRAQELRKAPYSSEIKIEESDSKRNWNDTKSMHLSNNDKSKAGVILHKRASLSMGKFETWTTEDVAKWIEALDSGKLKIYSKCFRENKVDGSLLADLSANEMKNFFIEDLKISKAGDRLKLLRAILNKTQNLKTRLSKDLGWLDDELKLESRLSVNDFQESGLFKSARLAVLLVAANNDDSHGKALLAGLNLLKPIQLKVKSLEKKTIQHDAFLSHVQADSADLCRSLHGDLFKEKQIKCWYDMVSNRLDAWGMAEGVATAKVFVAVVTQNYFVREWPVFEFLLAELLGKHIILLRETVKSHGGFDTFKEFRASIPEYFSKWLNYEVCEVKRRGTFWGATIHELAKKIKLDAHEKILSPVV